MKLNKYIAAVVQLDTQGDYEANLSSASELIAEAAGRGAKLAVLPEYWAYQGKEYLKYAEKMPGGPSFQAFSALAKKHDIWIHTGSSCELVEGEEKPMNTSMIINPQGELVAKYRKIHAFDADVEGAGSFRESDSKKAGSTITVVDTPLGKLGCSICYDMRFPELYRLMAMEGAEVLFAPSSFLLMTGKDHWETLLRARAIENSCYMIAPSQCGVKHDGPTYGRSVIIDPWGTVIATASDKPCVITAEIDLDFRMKVKKQVITLENRREDVYRLEKR